MSQITFTNIPVGIKTPGVFIDIKNQQQQTGLPHADQKILILGQRLESGEQAALSPVRITSPSQAMRLFGKGSNIALMCDVVLKNAPIAHISACAADDQDDFDTSVHAITFDGQAEEAQAMQIQIGHQSITKNISIGDSAADIAEFFKEIVDDAEHLSVAAEIEDAVLTLTAKNKGVLGNINIKIPALPQGLTAEIEQTTAGSGTPDITDILAAIGDAQYTSIISPYSGDESISAIEDELADRFLPEQQKTGHVFTAKFGTHAALITYGSDRNSPHSSCLGLKDSQTPEYITACIFAAACHQAGSIDPARPFQTLSLQGITPPSIENRFTQTERNLLLQNGISTSTTDNQGIQRLERVITTYQSDAQGLSDESYLDLNSKWTIDYIRFAINQRIAQTFPRHKLANDGTNFAPGQAIATPKIIKAEIIALLRDLEEHGLIEDLNGSVEQIEVIRNRDDASRVDASIPVDLINGMRVLAASLEFKL